LNIDRVIEVIAGCVGVGLLLLNFIAGFLIRDHLAITRYTAKKNYAKVRMHSARLAFLLNRFRVLKWLMRFYGASRDWEAISLNALGRAEIALLMDGKAQRHLKDAMALEPTFPQPYYNMGRLALQAGARVEAKAWFEKAIALGMEIPDLDQRIAYTDITPISPSAYAPPPLPVEFPGGETVFAVNMLNDDKTPMEFVIHVLERVFQKTREEAKVVMLEVHRNGTAVCGYYGPEEAEAKVKEVMGLAYNRGYPLKLGFLPVPSDKV